MSSLAHSAKANFVSFYFTYYIYDQNDNGIVLFVFSTINMQIFCDPLHMHIGYSQLLKSSVKYCSSTCMHCHCHYYKSSGFE